MRIYAQRQLSGGTMKSFKDWCEELEKEIVDSYTEILTTDKAESLAGKFLHAQLIVSQELKKADLDARMRKSGLKAIQAAVYLTETQGKDKKPTEAALQHTINTTEAVNSEQDKFDSAEVDRNELERYYNIFTNAHIFYRGVSKGRFNE